MISGIVVCSAAVVGSYIVYSTFESNWSLVFWGAYFSAFTGATKPNLHLICSSSSKRQGLGGSSFHWSLGYGDTGGYLYRIPSSNFLPNAIIFLCITCSDSSLVGYYLFIQLHS